MGQFSGPEEIYDELVEKSEHDWLLGLVAFAVVEEQKIEWIKHKEAHNGEKPSPDEICEWYRQQPEGVLLRAVDTAETRLKDYSNVVVEAVISETIEEIKEDVVIEEIRELKRFWPQFGVNLVGGFVSAILFAALLVFVAFLVFNDTSPIQIGSHIGQTSEVNAHDEVRSNE